MLLTGTKNHFGSSPLICNIVPLPQTKHQQDKKREIKEEKTEEDGERRGKGWEKGLMEIEDYNIEIRDGLPEIEYLKILEILETIRNIRKYKQILENIRKY